MCAHKLQTGRHGTQLFPGRTPADPFYPSTIRLRAPKAWGWKLVPNPEPGPPQQIWIKCRGDALQPLTPHEARHCAASCMSAAGMDWKKITEFIGHSDVRTTYNRYGKVVPDDLAPAAAQLEEYFDRGRARLQPRPRDRSETGAGSVTEAKPPTRHRRVTDSGIGSARCAQASQGSCRRGWGRGPRSKPEIAGSASR
jgi:hypothetical protein